MLALLSLLVSLQDAQPQRLGTSVVTEMRSRGLTDLGAYAFLSELTGQIGSRLSGSPGAEKAVVWTEAKMKEIGLDHVQRIPCMVPQWVRGSVEKASMKPGGKLAICALGGSVGTKKGGLEAEVIEVHSLEEAEQLGDKAKGKIVFYNRGFDPTLPSTFEAYGGAVNQRFGGAVAAAKSGAVGVLVRSMTLATDDEPHTGGMGYEDGVPQIPAAALGIQSANRLSEQLKKGTVKVRLELSCENRPDVLSASVAGDLTGSEKPSEIIVIGGHLDSWDLGKGAHDDGAGVCQALEAVRLMKVLGLRPKRTIRVIAFMNEENGLRGALAYGEVAKNNKLEKHYAAIESDAGGFMPREFGTNLQKFQKAIRWQPVLQSFGIERFTDGGGDADIGPLEPLGTMLFGLVPDNQRYFDYHHSRNDTLDKVNPRELEFGALAMGALAWLISEEGLEVPNTVSK